MLIITNYPKEITRDEELNFDIASFSYYDGIAIAEERGLKQTTEFKQVFENTHFIACCGDIMLRVKRDEYPELNRRIL